MRGHKFISREEDKQNGFVNAVKSTSNKLEEVIKENKDCEEMEYDKCAHCIDSYFEYEMWKMVEVIRRIERDPQPDLYFKPDSCLIVCKKYNKYLKCS